MPVLEFIPFSATLAGAALTGCGLALIARDGVMAVLAMTFTAGLGAVVAYYVLSADRCRAAHPSSRPVVLVDS